MMALKNEVALDGTLMTAICLLDESKRPGQEPKLQQDMRGQYLQVMEALTIRLRAAGATWDDVVYRRPFVLDMDAFIKTQTDPTMTYPWHRPPPSTLVGVIWPSHSRFSNRDRPDGSDEGIKKYFLVMPVIGLARVTRTATCHGAFGPAARNQSAICAPVQNFTSLFWRMTSRTRGNISTDAAHP
jgi:hypothetical protein